MPRFVISSPGRSLFGMVVAAAVMGGGLRLARTDLLLQGIVAVLGLSVLYLLWTNYRCLATHSPVESEGNSARKTRDPLHLEALWHRAPLGIMLLDPHDPEKVVRILDCNQTACEMHGYTREELIGQSIDLIEATPWNQWREQWFEGLKKNQILQGEGNHRRKDGSVFPTEYFTSLIKVEDEELVIGMDLDATARRAAEAAIHEARKQAELADRAKSEFLAVMSHEIRTPMNGIIGFTNLLYDTSLNAEQRDWLATIRSSGETLLTLINDILDFSKIESGKMDLDIRPARIARCVEEAVDLLWSKANEKHIELLVWIAPETPEWVLTDITRFRQIVLNLLGNAIKFTSKGEIEVRVEPYSPPETEDRAQLSITVRDTGVGIPLDRVERLFKPFSQADSSTTREFGGTGLGLVISRRLSELLGGSVELLHTNHNGSTFRFTSDAPACPAPDGDPTPVFLDEEAANLRGKRVLIVDDNLTNCRILRSLMERWHMIPESFSGSGDALNRLLSGARFDIALLDMMMPGMNGIQLAQKIRGDVTGENLPLILVSSVGQEELGKHDSDTLFKDVLHKPLRQSILLNSMVTALGLKPHAPAPTVLESSKFDAAMASNHPLNLLVAEDNPVNRKLIQRLLQRLGYAPTLVNNGRECIQALTDGAFDAILMDCQMPVLDGYETTIRIRNGSTGSDNRSIPIIALTAAAMVGDRERCLDVGMNDYLTKPIHPEDLVQMLRSIQGQIQK